MGIPLVRNNSVDDINTSIIAIKKELGKGGSGDMGDVNVNVDVKYEVTDTVEDGNSLPVTSQGVYDYVEGQGFTPVDEVAINNMKAVTSNAVAESLSYSTTEQKTGGKVVINGVEKDEYKKELELTTPSNAGSGFKIGTLGESFDKITKIDGIVYGTNFIITINMPGWTTTWLDDNGDIYMQISNVAIATKPTNVKIRYTKNE